MNYHDIPVPDELVLNYHLMHPGGDSDAGEPQRGREVVLLFSPPSHSIHAEKENVMIQGRVIDGESSTPLSDVVVSNGRDCVRTGEDGRFELPMPAQPETNNGVPLQVFAFVSTPAGYRPEAPGGWYRAAEDGDDD